MFKIKFVGRTKQLITAEVIGAIAGGAVEGLILFSPIKMPNIVRCAAAVGGGTLVQNVTATKAYRILKKRAEEKDGLILPEDYVLVEIVD